MNTDYTLSQAAAENPAFMNILARVSVRRYSAAAVPDGLKAALLRAGMSAPSGVNRQPWEFILIDDRELLRSLAAALPYAKMATQAPMAIAVCGNSARFLEATDSTLWVQDLSAASENILLAAHALGLGGVWTCLYPHHDRMDAAAGILSIPEGIIPFSLIPIGYPDRDHVPMDKWHPDRIHLNRF